MINFPIAIPVLPILIKEGLHNCSTFKFFLLIILAHILFQINLRNNSLSSINYLLEFWDCVQFTDYFGVI